MPATFSVGSSAAEHRYAKAEARVQFPAGALCFAVVTQSAECRSSKPQTWVRLPLTALMRSRNAVVAQWAEQSSRKRPVAGSIPARGLGQRGEQKSR